MDPKQPQNKVVQTYAEDIAQVINSDKEGLVKKIIHGEEEHEEEKENLSPESKKNKMFMIVSVVLIFLSLATLSFLLFKKTDEPVPVEKQFVPIIFSDKNTSMEISGLKKDEIAQAVSNAVDASSIKAGGVEAIYLTVSKQIIGLRKFISLINSSFIPGDNTIFVSDDFMMGLVKNQADSDPFLGNGFFILLKVRSTADIFDSMRNWENNMLTDLHGFLKINLGSDTSYLFKKNFEDGIIENKNARILYDSSGKIILMYIFADDNSVVITNSQDTAHEVILRLTSSQTKQ